MEMYLFLGLTVLLVGGSVAAVTLVPGLRAKIFGGLRKADQKVESLKEKLGERL